MIYAIIKIGDSMDNLDFTFLTYRQVYGVRNNYGQLNVLKKYGLKCAVTDFAVLLGCKVGREYLIKEGDPTKYSTASAWWTKTQHITYDEWDDVDLLDPNDVDIIGENGTNRQDCWVGARPAISYSSISALVTNVEVDERGIKIVEFGGEYPQTIVDNELANELEKCYKGGKGLRKTGKHYTSIDGNSSNKHRKHVEFEYNGKKYIRVVCNFDGKGEILSDGTYATKDKTYWVAVEPIKWLVDEESDIAISEKILFSGMPFDLGRKRYSGDFNNTYIKKFMNKYFSKEIAPQNKKNDKVDFVYPVEETTEKTDKNDIKRKSRKRKINKGLASIQIDEIEELSQKLAIIPDNYPEKRDLVERFRWICTYFDNNYDILSDNKRDMDDIQYREIINDFTLDLNKALTTIENEINNGDLHM